MQYRGKRFHFYFGYDACMDLSRNLFFGWNPKPSYGCMYAYDWKINLSWNWLPYLKYGVRRSAWKWWHLTKFEIMGAGWHIY